MPVPFQFQMAVLAALNVQPKHVYAGTVPDDVIARRRAKNKAARRARRVTRMRAA